jgi:hypothetical protein
MSKGAIALRFRRLVMRKVALACLIVCGSLVGGQDRAAAQSRPPVAPAGAEPQIQIKLLGKQESVIPTKYHDAVAERGKIEVTNAEGDELEITLTAATAAHCFVGAQSLGTQSMNVVQEFELACTDRKVTAADVSIESTLKGYVRARHKGLGSMRVATAAVYTSSGAPTSLSVTYPPSCATGGCAMAYEQERKVPVVRLPLGRYVLVARFVLQAEASGLTNGRGVADFSQAALPDGWEQQRDPFKDVKRDGFGFSLTLAVAVPDDDDDD